MHVCEEFVFLRLILTNGKVLANWLCLARRWDRRLLAGCLAFLLGQQGRVNQNRDEKCRNQHHNGDPDRHCAQNYTENKSEIGGKRKRFDKK